MVINRLIIILFEEYFPNLNFIYRRLNHHFKLIPLQSVWLIIYFLLLSLFIGITYLQSTFSIEVTSTNAPIVKLIKIGNVDLKIELAGVEQTVAVGQTCMSIK